jgi:LacI family gluconate utilization system Gnt-I transcriptional repressor
LGIAVPEQMGIAGFHDLEVGRVVSPTLTTVQVPAMEMGRKAGHMILARLGGKRLPTRRQDLGFSIISRESTRRSQR